MEIRFVSGFSVITRQPDASASLYLDMLGLPLERYENTGYHFMDHFPGAKHFGVWPLEMAAQSCFGRDEWPASIPEPTATIDFELADAAAVASAVQEMEAKGQDFVHGVRTEPWGQTVARFISPEGVLITLSYAPWFHEQV
jgi:catechol 2,3-dioxygenase-like lactoylglutathione lyase family enzyme